MSGRRGLHPSVVLFACLFAAQAAILVLSPILPQVADEFGVSTATAAQLRSVSGVTAGILALGIAATGGRYRLTSLLTGGLALLAAASLASAVAPSFALLAAAQVVIGVGLAMVLSGGLAASEAWAPEGEGARVLSWALVGQPVAWIVGQPAVGWVAATDWRWAWVAVPLASSVVALGVTQVRDRAVSEAGRECDPLGLWRLPG
jgi:MFS transporter, DHA1 family, inner membrane transport protein